MVTTLKTPDQLNPNQVNGSTAPDPNPITTVLAELRQKVEQKELERDPLDPHWIKDKLNQVSDLLTRLPVINDAWSRMTQHLRHSGSLLADATREIRTTLCADRVLIYRYSPDMTQGSVVAESVLHGYTPTLGEQLPALAFGLASAPLYDLAQGHAIADIYAADFTPHQQQIQERFQVRALLAMPHQHRARGLGGCWWCSTAWDPMSGPLAK
ncbi:MAG: hypothetical protein HC818_03050 [Synechococcaceae cyanobacterium RM1_1_27]|nr:hypothetical protein [Synechococcaceae cyanobacterium RM1_1_27]